MLVLLGLGLIAGVLTTIAGMGGGLLLVVALSALQGPHIALAITTPALLLSNLHRAYLFRKVANRDVAKAFALGAIPGAFVAGWLVPRLPEVLLKVVLAGATLLTLARVVGWFRWRPGPRAITTGGIGIGVLTATAGGAGVLTGPLFMGAGLTGATYVGTIALGAVALHLGRVLGYSAGGLFALELVAPMAILAFGLIAGNFAGKRLRRHITDKIESRVELCALVLCTTFAVLGLGT